MRNGDTVSVLFCCLGNICRSPTAQGVFEALRDRQGLTRQIAVDSCGTGDWHVGSPPDRRAAAAALARGYDLSHLRARQVARRDFGRFDYILAMDRQNLAELRRLQPAGFSGHLGLFLPFARAVHTGSAPLPEEVPDPYYGGDEGFARVLDLVEMASEGLLREIAGAGAAR